MTRVGSSGELGPVTAHRAIVATVHDRLAGTGPPGTALWIGYGIATAP
jgi:hypothetical protein